MDPVWTVRILTLFPEMFPGPLGLSLAGRALENRIWSLETVDIRTFGRDKHRTVDDTPFGGGPGMVMRADVLDAALTAATGGPESSRARPCDLPVAAWPAARSGSSSGSLPPSRS